jgi:intein/homing endonuclease
MTKKEKIELAVNEYINSGYSISLTKLSEKYGVKRQTISKYVKQRGVEVINTQNACRINESIFEIIDTEVKAYWLGFLFADGCIYENEKRFRMNLSIKDIDHMEKFAKFMNFTGEIRKYKGTGFNGKDCEDINTCSVQFRNSKLWNDLNSKGCTPNKSLTLKFPDKSIFKSGDLIRHFIRGYVDGDGYLINYKSNNTKKQELGMVGTVEFLESVNSFIKPVKGKIRSKDYKDHPNKAYRLNYTYISARKVARYLYENATVYLDRKYNKFLEFCHFEEGSSTAKSSKIGEDWNVDTEVNP